MATNPISTSYVPPSAQPKSAASSTLDKNGFLKMLTEQIKNQDPSSNQDPNQYFQTISSMTMVEQMTNVATMQRQASATALLGRTVSYTDLNGAPVTGVVDNVTLAGSDGPTLSINGVAGITMDKIGSVR
ncbi:hypothetical protein FSW04_04065 [Baekduia soli]|uniref:Flagellar hook capping protein n=1 Tax=Baekduia soli TaxID=496014 RepID=A0A5B8U1G4_9ACTN|nr:flagellar hook capping FlgD N-terminal domain-containing protein [Baekduia soli]QEC46843.1 hypothetical protein FSW04_04065 [Baekduia soli]